jgi:hypothetical protein
MAMAADALQDEWCRKPISEVAPIDATPILPTETPLKKFFYVALENIESGTGRLVGSTQAQGDSIKSNKFQFGLEHVLLGKLRPYLNKVIIPAQTGICSTDILPLKPDSKLLTREFLGWCLRSPDFIGYSSSKMEGGKMPRLRTPDLESYEIPVPPLAEQRRIVARVEALTRRLDQARQTRQAAIAEAENFVVSARKSIFSDEAAENWEAFPFPDATKRVQPRAGKLKTDEYHDCGALPIVDQGQKLICGYTDDISRKFQGPLPVIVFGDHTRNVKFVDFDFAVGADGTVLLHSCDRIEPRFFYHWLCAVELHNLGYSRHFKLLAETTVRFPADRDEQKRIAARLDTFAAKLDELQRLQREVEAELASFTPALLAKAFRGEI